MKNISTELKSVSKKAEDNRDKIEGLSEKLDVVETTASNDRSEAMDARSETNKLLLETKNSLQVLFKQNMILHSRANIAERKRHIGIAKLHGPHLPQRVQGEDATKVARKLLREVFNVKVSPSGIKEAYRSCSDQKAPIIVRLVSISIYFILIMSVVASKEQT